MTVKGVAVNEDIFGFGRVSDDELVKDYHFLKDLPPYINGWGERLEACIKELEVRGIEINK